MLLGFILFCIYLGATILLLGAMLLSLSKKGDENRQVLVWKASKATLGVTLSIVSYSVIANFFKPESAAGHTLLILSVIAITYFIALFYYQKQAIEQ